MKILIGDRGNVDFDSPIQMSTDQKDRFIDFLKTLFSVVEEEYSDEIRSERIGDKFFMKDWSVDEYAKLLEVDTKTTERLSEELGRTWMSVDIKRGDFIPEYLFWTQKKGVDLLSSNTKELIKEFLKENEDKIKNRRMKNKELKKLLKEKEFMESEESQRILKSYERIGKKSEAEEFKNHLKDINKKIIELEKELGE